MPGPLAPLKCTVPHMHCCPYIHLRLAVKNRKNFGKVGTPKTHRREVAPRKTSAHTGVEHKDAHGPQIVLVGVFGSKVATLPLVLPDLRRHPRVSAMRDAAKQCSCFTIVIARSPNIGPGPARGSHTTKPARTSDVPYLRGPKSVIL